MKFIYKLFKYQYKYYVQGTEEIGVEYALLYVPESATFNNNRSTLVNRKHREYYHEILLETVEDLSVSF